MTKAANSAVQIRPVINGRRWSHINGSTEAVAPLISRSLSQTPSVSSGTAADVVSNNYNNKWATTGTVSGQYCSFYVGDKVSAGAATVGIFWMNDGTYGLRPDLTGGGTYYNVPGDYQVRVNTAGAGARPTTGWVTVVTVAGNNYTKRMHTISMTGYNWVELYFTASNGSTGNFNIELKCDLYDVTNGWNGCVLAVGDSIIANSMLYKDQGSATSAYPDLANAAGGYAASKYPLLVDAGIPGWSCYEWITTPGILDEVLSLFPTQIVLYSIGANDAGAGSGGVATFASNILTMSNKVKALSRACVWSTITWSSTRDTSLYNAKITELKSANSWVMSGYDHYAYYFANQTQITNNDGLHPDNTGVANYRSHTAGWFAALTGLTFG